MQQDDFQFNDAVRDFRGSDEVMITDKPALYKLAATDSLTWWEEHGFGYYPVTAGVKPYDEAYWDRYKRQSETEIGMKLTRARVQFVERHWPNKYLVDVGIGSGAFINSRNSVHPFATSGYDVNPHACEWLRKTNQFADIYKMPNIPAVSFWDVLEHIPDFQRIVNRVGVYVFVSIPIFQNAAHVLRSKHYRKDEHVWYFADKGLEKVFNWLGFELVEHNIEETAIGREDIGSFAFRRIMKW